MQLIQGFLDYFRVFPILMKRQLLPYVMIPAAIALVLLALLWTTIYSFAGSLGAQITSWIGLSGAWAATGASILSGLLMAFVSLLLLRYVLIILCSPVLSIISERVEQYLHPDAEMPPFSLQQMGYGMWRGLRFAIRNVGRELLLTLLLLALSLMPGLVVVTSVLLVLLQAYYIGYGHLDFALERKLSIRDTVDLVHRHRGYTIGNGLAFWLLLFIPVIGLVIALPVGAAAATYGLVTRPERFDL